MGVLSLIIYMLLWLFTLIHSYKKKRTIDAGNLLILLFFVYSVFSIFLYLDTEGRGFMYKSYSIPLFPLLFLYGMIMISMSPVLKFDLKRVSGILGPSSRALDLITWIFIIASVLKLPADIMNIRTGITSIIMDSSAGLDIYKESMENSQASLGDGAISNLPAIISNLLSDFMCLVLVYYIIIKKNKKMILALSFAILTIPFGHLASSQRGPAISIIFSLAISYFALRQYVDASIKKKIELGAVAFVIAFSIPFMAITYSRFDRSDGGVGSSFLDYLGQENVNFAEYAFDNNGLRYGDRTFPLFKRMLGFKNVPHNFWERRDKYPYLKINDEVFIGYVGDFCLDFGPFITLIIFIFFSRLFYLATLPRRGIIHFQQLIILHFLMLLGMQGGMKLFPFADGAGLKIIVYIMLFIYFSIDNKKQRQLTYGRC